MLKSLIQSLLCGDEGRRLQDEAETCRWFNLIGAFLFQELRDSMIVKRYAVDRSRQLLILFL